GARTPSSHCGLTSPRVRGTFTATRAGAAPVASRGYRSFPYSENVPTWKESPMPATSSRQNLSSRNVTRRDFLKRASVTSAGVAAFALGVGRGRALAQPAAAYPDWIAASPKPPRRGGVLTRASAWDPPVIDPRHTQSVGLFQFAGLTSNRLLRYAFADEVTGYNDLSLK